MAETPEETAPGPERAVSLEEAYAHCAGLTGGHYENFPVGSRSLPPERRRYVHAIYAFSRTADDFADEKISERPPEERLRLLEDWDARLSRAAEGQPRPADGPIFLALADTLEKCRLPAALFHNLLTAFKMDVTVLRYKDFEQLLGYCRCSANPVGRLVLHLFGYTDPALFEQSDAICTALQLANHWQDVAVDLEKDRIYLPEEDILRFGYSYEDLQARRFDACYAALLRFEVERAWELFRRGRPLCDRVGKDIRREMRLTWLGGTRILEKIEAQEYNTLAARPKLGFLDKARIVWRYFCWKSEE